MNPRAFLVPALLLTACNRCPHWLPVWTPFCRVSEPEEAKNLIEQAEAAENAEGCLSSEEVTDALDVKRSAQTGEEIEPPSDPARRARFYGTVESPTGRMEGGLDVQVTSDDQVYVNAFFGSSCDTSPTAWMEFPVRCVAEQGGSLFFSSTETSALWGIVFQINSQGLLTEETFNLTKGTSTLWPDYAPTGLKSAGVNIPECP